MATNGFEYGGLRIEAVVNGFIISSDCEKWVFSTLNSALKFIEQSFKKEPK